MWLRNEDFYAYFRSYKWVENFNNQQIRLGEFISPNYAHLLVSSSLWIVNEAFTQYVFLLMEKYGDNFRHHSPPTKVVWGEEKKAAEDARFSLFIVDTFVSIMQSNH